MEIFLRNFGTTLISRPSGNEAFKVFEPNLMKITDGETLTIDFEGVITFSPSWGDEFVTPLVKKYGDKLILKNTENPSVKASLRTLEDTNAVKMNIVS